ncbi:prolyl oligopeptidase family serine peptidase [Roseivirga sp. BDSF3-8]|uniref:S9 family peptidase n=1 Tax=Roseivirga sp. BDSF3-8 TaxID=3241598 RepID=UPI0035326CF6
MKKYFIIILSTLVFQQVLAQGESDKKPLTHDVYDSWNTVREPLISNNGEVVTYLRQPQEGDGTLMIKKPGQSNSLLQEVPRGKQVTITEDDRFVIFSIVPHMDTVKNMRRRKVKDDKLPKDTLAIYTIANDQLVKIPRVRGYKTPEKGSGWLAYQLEEALPEEKDTTETAEESDTTRQEPEKKKKSKKVSTENGYHVVLQSLESGVDGSRDTIEFVTDYLFDEEGNRLMFTTTGNADSTMLPGVYVWTMGEDAPTPIYRSKGKYKSLTLDKAGRRGAFMADTDTTEARIRNYTLHYWEAGKDSVKLVADSTAGFMPENWIVSEHSRVYFSENGERLFFGVAPRPVLQDTSLLQEEIVDVQVWNYQDDYLQPQQAVNLDRTKKQSFTSLYKTDDGETILLHDEELEDLNVSRDGEGRYALAIDDRAYRQLMSWEGFPTYKDIYKVDLETGRRELIGQNLRATVSLSPAAKYIYWYDVKDSAWFAHNNDKGTTRRLTDNEKVSYFDELHDVPDYPYPYGVAGWTKDDKEMLIYDRFDIWRLDPDGGDEPENLTNLRDEKIRVRYLDLDRENEYIDPKQPVILTAFNERTRGEGFYRLNLRNEKLEQLLMDDYSFGFRVKAEDDDHLMITRESFQDYPDLYYTTTSFDNLERVSEVNPQQGEYLWGTVELVDWTSFDGQQLEGLLYKPENFDPNKKYPMIVYFYERVSDRLNRHVAPTPSPSTVRASFYTSNGYIVFMPDIPYTDGYPGQSAYNAIVSGTYAMMEKGFVDKDAIALQGQSWGGYQTAYLITQTDLYAAAMAGAPVSNMTSAYGGIRWGSGLSRMFQYERTQSRIGGTLWEKPLLYLDNSPLFHAPQVNTPLLMMHNDGDGAVPWYQGIEYFMALRRLGKPVWMLNYKGEEHNLMQRKNRKDLSKRMKQFFDHYLKGEPAPEWMVEGVPAIRQSIDQGFELISNEGE